MDAEDKIHVETGKLETQAQRTATFHLFSVDDYIIMYMYIPTYNQVRP